jgi:hypothetical protein
MKDAQHKLDIEVFDESKFRANIARAQQVVLRVLENEKSQATLLQDSPHNYGLKFLVCAELTKRVSFALSNVCGRLGLTGSVMQQALEWATERAVTLRFNASEQCVFLRKEKREVTHDTATTSTKGVFKVTDKVVTTIKDYYYRFTWKWSLLIVDGADEEEIVLQTRTSSTELKVGTCIEDYMVMIHFAIHTDNIIVTPIS